MNLVIKPNPVELARSYASYYEWIEGIDSIDGQTTDLIHSVWELSTYEYTDGDLLQMIEEILQNYHQWHKQEWKEEEVE
jgi:hypothetical protein